MKKDSLVYFFAFFAITIGVLLVLPNPTKAPDCQQTIDSLHSELFIQKTYVGRYELTLEHLREVDPEAAKKFSEYLEHKTE